MKPTDGTVNCRGRRPRRPISPGGPPIPQWALTLALSAPLGCAENE